MRWSEFKNQVDEKLEGKDPEILYLDIDDGSMGDLDVIHTDIGLIITENGGQ